MNEFELITGTDVDNAPPIHDIVAQFLQETPMTVLRNKYLGDAVTDYAVKHDTDAIEDFVKSELLQVQNKLYEKKEVNNLDTLEEALNEITSANREPPTIVRSKQKRSKQSKAKNDLVK